MARKPTAVAAEPIEAPEEDKAEPIAAESPTEESGNTVTNCLKGTVLHLGDGRRLAFGESAEVSAALKAQLVESGQAR